MHGSYLLVLEHCLPSLTVLDGKLFLEELHNLNAPNAINPVSLSDKSIVGKKSFRFEVNHGECGKEPKFSDCENERERSELYYKRKSN